jgi:hypothetical protein
LVEVLFQSVHVYPPIESINQEEEPALGTFFIFQLARGVIKQKVVAGVVQGLQKARATFRPDIIAQMTTIRPLA